MSTENTEGNPANEPLDEMLEAQIADNIRKLGGIDPKTTADYKSRKDVFDGLIGRGMPREVVEDVVGGLIIAVPENKHGTEIYLACLDNAIDRLHKLYLAFTEEGGMGLRCYIKTVDRFRLLCVIG
jgi:hypothetical protein